MLVLIIYNQNIYQSLKDISQNGLLELKNLLPIEFCKQLHHISKCIFWDRRFSIFNISVPPQWLSEIIAGSVLACECEPAKQILHAHSPSNECTFEQNPFGSKARKPRIVLSYECTPRHTPLAVNAKSSHRRAERGLTC